MVEKAIEQMCPGCGCAIGESGYEKEGVMYCSEPCAEGNCGSDCKNCHMHMHLTEAEVGE